MMSLRAVATLATVTIILNATTTYAQDIPGRWIVGIKGGSGFLPDEIVRRTDGKPGPIVSGTIAYSPIDLFSLGINIEWEAHKLEPGVSGNFTTVSLIPFTEIRLNVSRVFIPYASLGVGININSQTDARIKSCIGSFVGPGFAIFPCNLEPDNSFALKVGGGIDYYISEALALNTEIAWKMNAGDAELCVEGSGCPGTVDFDANVFMILFGIRYYFDKK